MITILILIYTLALTCDHYDHDRFCNLTGQFNF